MSYESWVIWVMSHMMCVCHKFIGHEKLVSILMKTFDLWVIMSHESCVFDWKAWPGLHAFRILQGGKDYLLRCSGYGHPFQICWILKSEGSSVFCSKYACLLKHWVASSCDAKIINAPAVLLRQTAKAIWSAIASKQMVHPFSSFLSFA